MRPIVTGPAMAVTHAGLAGPRLAEHPDSHRFTSVHVAVLAAMGWRAARDDADPRCRASLPTIAAMARCDVRTAARAQQALEEAGAIERLPSRPRQPVEWRLRLLGERPDYGQRVRSDYGQRVRRQQAESPQTTDSLPYKSKKSLGSPRVTSGAGAPTAAAPWMIEQGEGPRPPHVIAAALAATPEQVDYARALAEAMRLHTEDPPGLAQMWPELTESDAIDVAYALVAKHDMQPGMAV